MRLSYRGVSYEYTPTTLEVTEGEILGKYRGQPWRQQSFQDAPAQPIRQLKYRGVSYYTNRYGGVNTAVRPEARPATSVPAAASVDRQPAFEGNAFRVKRQDWVKVHHDNLRRNLERRLESARARGDQSLVSQLEREMQYIA